MPDKVSITKTKLDLLANAISSKTGEPLPLTIDQMKTAVVEKCEGLQEQVKGLQEEVEELSPTKILIWPEQTVTPEKWSDNYYGINLNPLYLTNTYYMDDSDYVTVEVNGLSYLFDSIDVNYNGVEYNNVSGNITDFGAQYDSETDTFDFSEYPFGIGLFVDSIAVFVAVAEPITISIKTHVSGVYITESGIYNANANGIKRVIVDPPYNPLFELTINVVLDKIRSFRTCFCYSENGSYKVGQTGVAVTAKDTIPVTKAFKIFLPYNSANGCDIYLAFKSEQSNGAESFTGFRVTSKSDGIITANFLTTSMNYNVLSLDINSGKTSGSINIETYTE